MVRGGLTREQGERLMAALDAVEETVPRDDDRTRAMRRADAIEKIADSFLASPDRDAARDSSGGDRYTLHVHTRIGDLRAAADHDDVPAETCFRGNVFALFEAHWRRGLGIGRQTLVSRWHGERMDLGMAIDGLRRRDFRHEPRGASG